MKSILRSAIAAFLTIGIFLNLDLRRSDAGTQQQATDKTVGKLKQDDKTKINDDPLAHVKKTDKPNGLIDETSPYLLMHAYNPVQWRPWNAESLALAKKENKPIFLSIGYSSCHWCHVMERESFMDKEIAKYLNENYICIKVDREERPDVDAIYMTSLSVFNALSRNGGGTGWPLSMFLTPDAKPFFGGTYFPARDGDRGARIGFYTIVQRINDVWKARTAKVKEDAEVLTEYVKKELDGTKKNEKFVVEKYIIDLTVSSYAETFDSDWGGFGFSPSNDKIPKFPQPANLFALLEAAKQWQSKSAENMLVKTLEKMYFGGIYDHVGGGFHRYSVDRYWRIPHFEKMLYDNGQLASLYAEASDFTKREDFAEIAHGICRFVLSEMTAPDGGFYSAMDAESDGEEGVYYVWKRDEIKKIVGEKEYGLFASVFQIDAFPNFENDNYALQLRKRLGESALEKSLKREQLIERLNRAKSKLKEVRDTRDRPLTDTKILTGWNGLMIRGMADAGRILKEQKYVDAAEKAADFVASKMRNEKGRLLRTHRKGQSKLNGYLDDYAFFIDGLIALHRATGNKKWLDLAVELQKTQDQLFWDEDHGGYFFTADDHQSLLARAKNPSDGARPSGNGMSALNLLYLFEQLKQDDYKVRAQKTIDAFAGTIGARPRFTPNMVITVSRLLKMKTDE